MHSGAQYKNSSIAGTTVLIHTPALALYPPLLLHPHHKYQHGEGEKGIIVSLYQEDSLPERLTRESWETVALGQRFHFFLKAYVYP